MALCLLVQSPAQAIRLLAQTDEELVLGAKAVIEGRVLRVIAPRKVPSGTTAHSVARIRVLRVYKGTLRTGATVDVLYWSHGQSRWFAPRTVRVKEQRVFVLIDRPSEDPEVSAVLAPPQARAARWVFGFEPYDHQIAAARFREVAEVYARPLSFLGTPRRPMALIFAAAQAQLSDPELRRSLKATDETELRAALIAAARQPRRSILPLLVQLGATVSTQTESALHQALVAAPLDLVADRTLISTLLGRATIRPSPQHWATKLRQAGSVVRAPYLAALLRARPSFEGLGLLQQLDARAAYPLVQRFAQGTGATTEGALMMLVNRYSSLWARRWVLKRGRTGSSHSDGSAVLAAFRFAHGEVNPIERMRKTHARLPNFWDIWSQEVQRLCSLEEQVFSRRGPNLARLATELASQDRWVLVLAKTTRVLTAAQVATAKQLLEAGRHARPRTATVRAQWLVDLYQTSYSREPRGQLWVSADGRYGLSWLPELVLGQAPELVKLLTTP